MTLLYIFEQELTELPYMVMCMAGIVVGIIFWRRVPLASMYIVLAFAVTLVFLLAHPVAWQIARHSFERDPQTVRNINVAFALFWSVERAIVGTLLLNEAAARGERFMA